jgi:hypothetical protein
MYTYEIIENTIKRTDEDGNVTWIPIEPANADYQEYLNKDKAEQSTPNLT